MARLSLGDNRASSAARRFEEVDEVTMSTTILTLEELQEARNIIDHLHEGVIDECAMLEGDNWGCPTEGTEEIRAVLKELSDMGWPFLEKLDKLIEMKSQSTEVSSIS